MSPAVSNLEYAGCFLFSLSCKPTRGLGIHETFPKPPFPLASCQFERWGALKHNWDNWSQRRKSTLSSCQRGFCRRGTPSQPGLTLPILRPHVQAQPFRAPRMLVSHFPFCPPNPGLKGNNYFFLNMLVCLFFFSVALLLFNFLSSKFLGLPW